MIYLIGSMRNARVPEIANFLRGRGFDIFDDWFSPGPEADDCWQAYEKERGRDFATALAGAHANEVFNFDKRHLDAAEAVVLVTPAGKSAHLELGYVIGCGKPGFIYMEEEPQRFDIMYKFATAIVTDINTLTDTLEALNGRRTEERSGEAAVRSDSTGVLARIGASLHARG